MPGTLRFASALALTVGLVTIATPDGTVGSNAPPPVPGGRRKDTSLLRVQGV
jgi:hypothetical protein